MAHRAIALVIAGIAGIGLAQGTATAKVPLPRPRPASLAPAPGAIDRPTPLPPMRGQPARSFAMAPLKSVSSSEASAVKEAIRLATKGRTDGATEIEQRLKDPVARKLVEWVILRSYDSTASLKRYVGFIEGNPHWPSIRLLRRRAEALFWNKPQEAGYVRWYFSRHPPLTGLGHFALARALLASDERTAARAHVRLAWINERLSARTEEKALDVFAGLITAADHKARMDMRLYAEDIEGGLRAAQRAGGYAPAIARARIAVIKKAHNAKALLSSVPAAARQNLGYKFSLAQWLRRNDRYREAGDVILSVGRNPSQVQDTDQWWIERRLAARHLLDIGEPVKAYRIARDAAVPKSSNYRAEHQFTAGWIALRFLHQPALALPHFARIAEGNSNPITLARAAYWQGRAYEAMGDRRQARAHYQAAAHYPTAYYGQLARARLGSKKLVLRTAAPPHKVPYELLRAVELLYAADQRNLIAGALADLGDRSTDSGGLALLAELARRHKDARTVLLIGKYALGHGLPLAKYAFPTMGIPHYRPIGPEVERCLVYAIARQESAFNQKTVSRAKAMGLLQVTPAAGRYIARKFHVRFNAKRLLSDPVYNLQLGSAELGNLLSLYRGSYILAFAGYNAGQGRVRQWIAQFGDPRDPRVDPVDWVERIPFSETRNYVQRVMENMQVYRARLDSSTKLMIEADLHRGDVPN